MTSNLHEWKEVKAIIYVCPSCHQELWEPPERGSCPSCSYHEMVPTKGSYKELVPVNKYNYKECLMTSNQLKITIWTEDKENERTFRMHSDYTIEESLGLLEIAKQYLIKKIKMEGEWFDARKEKGQSSDSGDAPKNKG